MSFSWHDAHGLGALYELTFARLTHHCRRMLGCDDATARDAAQETFTRVLTRQPALETAEDARRYLYRSATNLCINQLRARGRDTAMFEREWDTDEIASGCGEAAAADVEAFVELFRRSSQRDRLIFVWHHLGGASQTEIAEHLQVTRRTVYTRLRQVELTARGMLAGAGTASGAMDTSTGRR